MPRDTELISTFNAGVWSPLLEGRRDQAKYYNSLRVMENMIPALWGPAIRRSGTRYVTAAKSASVRPRLMDFEFSDEQAYAIEAGDGVFRFFKDQGRIVVADTSAVITNGTFPAGITDWDDRSTGGGTNRIAHDATNFRLSLIPDGAAADDIAWAEQDVTTTATNTEHVVLFQVFGAPGDRVELRIGSASTGSQYIADKLCEVGYHAVAFTPTASPFYLQFRNRGNFRSKTVQIDNVSLLDNAMLEIATPYAAADLATLKWAQSADVMYLASPTYAKRKMSRTGHTTWSLTTIADEDGPYLAENTSATTLTPGAATGLGQTLTASAIVGINNDEGFKTTDVGRLVATKQGSVWGWGVIVGWTSTTVVTIDIRSTLTDITAKATWRLGLYSDTTGHPSTVTLHEERAVWFGAAIEAPQRWDASETGEFETYTPGTADADAIAYNIGSNKVQKIRWATSHRALLVGCQSGEARIGSTSLNDPLTPTNTKTVFETRHGSADVSHVDASDAVVFVQRHGRKLRELAYTLDADGYRAADLTELAEHITLSGVREMAMQKVPWSIIWCVTENGRLIGMTYERENQVVAWSEYPLGGRFGAGAPVVESLTVIPGDGEDEVWLAVKRTINGATVRQIEYLDPRFDHDTPAQDAFFVDCGLTYSAGKTITGATRADPIVITTSAAHSLNDGDEVRIFGVEGFTDPNGTLFGMAALNGNVYTVANKTATTFELTDEDGVDIDGTANDVAGDPIFGSWISGGTVHKLVTTISGLDHLEGETVSVWADAEVRNTTTVAGGAITLDSGAGVVQVGLTTAWKLKPQRLEPGTKATALGLKQRIVSVAVQFHRTLGVSYGADFDDLTEIDFREAGDPMTQAVPLFSGLKTLDHVGEFDIAADFVLYGNTPSPVTVVALAPRIEVNEG